jgi:hypothetical protein
LLELVDNTVHTLFLIDYDNNCQHFVNGTGALLSVGVCAFVFSSHPHFPHKYPGNNDNLDDCIPVYIAPECKNVVDEAIRNTATTLSNLSDLQLLPSLKRVVVVHGGDKGYQPLEYLNDSDQSCIEVKQVSEHEYIFDDHIFSESEYSRLVCSRCLVIDTCDGIYVHDIFCYHNIGCRACRKTFVTLRAFDRHCDDKHHGACVKPDVVHCPESLRTEEMRKFRLELEPLTP